MENLNFTILFYNHIFFNCYIYTSYKLYNPRNTKSNFIFNYLFQHLFSDPQITFRTILLSAEYHNFRCNIRVLKPSNIQKVTMEKNEDEIVIYFK